AVAGISCFGVWYYQRGLGGTVVAAETPAVAVIVPIRGASAGLPEVWQGLRAPGFPRRGLLAAGGGGRDAAGGAVGGAPGGGARRRAAGGGRPELEIVIAGGAIDGGQKVWNQLAALAHLRPEDAVVVFADADTLPPPDWLQRLVRPLLDPATAAVSGNRWIMP